MTVKIENMKHQGAQARVLCSEARCPNVSKTGCRIMRTNIWPCFAKQLHDARKERKA